MFLKLQIRMETFFSDLKYFSSYIYLHLVFVTAGTQTARSRIWTRGTDSIPSTITVALRSIFFLSLVCVYAFFFIGALPGVSYSIVRINNAYLANVRDLVLIALEIMLATGAPLTAAKATLVLNFLPLHRAITSFEPPNHKSMKISDNNK